MVRGENNDNTPGGPLRKRWWVLVQILVSLIKRTEMPLQDAERIANSLEDAEQIANSLEMYPKLEWALRELKKETRNELYRIVLGMARNWPIDKLRILCGDRYIDLFDLYQPLPGVEPNIQFAAINKFVEDIRWSDVEGDVSWLRTFPVIAPAAETSAPAANTESVAKPETASPSSANATITGASTSPSKPPSEPRPLNGGSVDPTIAYALTKQLSSRRQPIGRALPSEPAPEPDASDNSARPPSVEKLKAFVAAYIKDTKASGKVPTQRGLCNAARNALPGATRERLHDEYKEQTPTLSPGRPRKEHK